MVLIIWACGGIKWRRGRTDVVVSSCAVTWYSLPEGGVGGRPWNSREASYMFIYNMTFDGSKSEGSGGGGNPWKKARAGDEPSLQTGRNAEGGH